MLLDRQEGLQEIIDKSFKLFLQFSNILKSDDLHIALLDAQDDEAVVNISPGIYTDPCQWLLELDEDQDPEKPFMREYTFFIQYKIDANLSYESCYNLIRDIKRNQLYHYQVWTRISEKLSSGDYNYYLVREGQKGDPIGIHIYS